MASPVPSKSKTTKKTHISLQPITVANWYEHIEWMNTIFVAIIPIIGLYFAFSTPLLWKTAIWTFIYYFLTGLGITAGYHRLWSHTSYTATLPIQIILAGLGGGAIQGSIRWWTRNHRAHHRYTDTAKDPYAVQRGMFHAHIGWLLFKQDKNGIGRVDITDLNNDPIVVLQNKHYVAVALTMAFSFPCVVAGLGWGDWKGGLIYAGILRLCVVQQATFCVNSLAHWIGDQPFDDRHSPRDHVITALVTLGEGYHNFHHEFPSDYRNAIQWYQYDPTKWCIWMWKQVGLARDLKMFPRNEIEKGILQQLQKKIDEKRETIDWGTPLSSLPLITWDDYRARVLDGEALIAIAGVIHDATDFIKEHPGGKALIASAVGKDTTAMFNGGVYNHSNAAHNLLSTMRVGMLRGGVQGECWKRRVSSGKGEMEMESVY